MSRKSFVLYTEWEDAFDGQPNDIAGELIKAIFDYVRTEEMPQTDNTVVNAMFSIFKPAIDRNIGKYDAAIKQRKEAALKSAESRKHQANDRKRTSTVSVSDSVSDTLSLNGERVREGANKVLDLQSIKEQLLSDETWKESACMQSTLGISFMAMLPDQLDKFIAYIVSIGEEQSISNISDAKRRFTYWWQNHGRKEVQDENKQVYTVPN